MKLFGKLKNEDIDALSFELAPWIARLQVEHEVELDVDLVARKLLRWGAYRVKQSSRDVRFRFGIFGGLSIRLIDRRGEAQDAFQLFALVVVMIALAILRHQDLGPTVNFLIYVFSALCGFTFLIGRLLRVTKDKDIWLKKS